MNILKIDSFPLTGQRLIEASAGTGKTYTIAALYLRLLLERRLDVTQLLVVTFTEAATQELRGRIRRRLREALLWFEGRHHDAGLADILAPYRDDDDSQLRLRDAITRMDEASIFTIHGFCQRSLTENAFESAVLFDNEFITDESPLRQQAIRDFWRSEVADADPAEVRWVLERWRTPEHLLADTAALIGRVDLRIEPDPSAESLPALLECRDRALWRFCQSWSRDGQQALALLKDAKVLSKAAKAFHPERLDELSLAVDVLCAGAGDAWVLPDGFELIASSRVNDPSLHKKSELKKGAQPPQHDLFERADNLLQLYSRYDGLRESRFMLEAADFVSDSLARQKDNSRMLFFDDLLSRLDSALGAEGGGELAVRLRQKYPVAMIDEFQDTDPVQYRIFQRIYAAEDKTGLLLIGDPKQAIYSFRGADIFTYMQARRDTRGDSNHFTLNTNYRSHSDLIDAVNAIFDKGRAPFVYDEDIEFHPVSGAVDSDAHVKPLTIKGARAEPLVCWRLPLTAENSRSGRITASWAKPRAAAATAAEISSLLALGSRGQAMIGDKPLAASDLAVLVRNRFEAADVRRAMNKLGIACVYISRDSVFNSDEAIDLSHLLRAIAEPGNPVLLRTAMATRPIGLTAAEIDALYHDSDTWERRMEQFAGYHDLWNRHGFMLMFHRLMLEQGAIGRLLSDPEGDRRMTNLLQLVELAQQAGRQRPGVENLLRWLEQQRASPDGNSEEQQLRMESDEQLVQIVTMHKSKGLEYPVVFAPFLWAGRELKPGRVLTYHDQDHSPVADLAPEHARAACREAARESLAEDLRLLYVTLTRAKFRCYFSWGKVNGAQHSALAYLLHQAVDTPGGEPFCTLDGLDDAAIDDDLSDLNCAGKTLLDLRALPDEGQPDEMPLPRQSSAAALPFDRKLRPDWRISSYSGLIQGASRRLDEQADRPEHDQIIADDAIVRTPSGNGVFDFPRGAQAGLLLHQLMERIDFTRVTPDALRPMVRSAIDQFGFEEKWVEVVTAWIEAILDTPLNDDGLRLRQLTAQCRLVEMEFQFSVNDLSPPALNGLVNSFRAAGLPRGDFDFASLSGFMKGFIDLVFEHAGRFYVLDYKSNHLGDAYSDYRQELLPQAMVSHDYDLQYLLYTLALHRYLAGRLPDYDYESHFGGVYYLFLRGMSPANGCSSGVYFDRPRAATIETLDLICRGGAS